MKNVILIAVFLLTSQIMIAQTDPSKMPEPGQKISINIGTPVTYKLANGLTLMVVENHKLPQVTISLSMDTPPSEEFTKVGLSSLTSALLGKGTKNMDKDTFNEEVEFLGGEISIGVKSARASTLSRYFPRVLELLADAALNPLFTQEELDKERNKAIETLKSGENSAQAVANLVNYALVYTTKHPYGEFRTEESLKRITLDDIENFYRENFSPSNAYMIVVGDVKAQQTKELVEKHFLKWIPSKPLQTSLYEPKNVQYTQVNLVDMPNAVQSELNVFNLQNLKMADKDLFAVMIMNYILGGGFGSYINYNLREQNGFTYGARSSVGFDKWTQATFSVLTKVRNEVVGAAIEEIIKEIKRIQTEEVSSEKLSQAKAQYMGTFIMSTENPATIARFALNIETQKLPKDFYTDYFQNILSVTAEDVKRVANKYIQINNLRFVVVGKKEEIAPQIEKMKFNGKAFPVFFYDRFANKVE